MSGMNSEMYLSEIFSSFQGEGGTVRGSCFGKRQIFIRFSGCNLYGGDYGSGDYGSYGCFWCDSPQARDPQQECFQYEIKPNSKALIKGINPVKISTIIDIVKNLITRDLHSISFTGGEPLYQKEKVLELSKVLKKQGFNYPLYLETNGSIKLTDEMMIQLAENFSYCCCDIKDKSSMAASIEMYDKLINMELSFLKQFVDLGVETYAKLVITSHTEIKDIQWICKQLSKIQYSNGQVIGLAIQPVTLNNEDLKIKHIVSIKHLNDIFQAAADFLPAESLSLSIQAHKCLNLL